MALHLTVNLSVCMSVVYLSAECQSLCLSVCPLCIYLFVCMPVKSVERSSFTGFFSGVIGLQGDKSIVHPMEGAL